jgi:sulfur relay (sulfurtransferase) DsrC/TusE family protein
MASNPRDTELLAQGSNLLAIEVTRHKFELFVHLRTFIPRHRVAPPMPKTVKYVSGIKRKLCVGYYN